jgi:hypothetical protein
MLGSAWIVRLGVASEEDGRQRGHSATLAQQPLGQRSGRFPEPYPPPWSFGIVPRFFRSGNRQQTGRLTLLLSARPLGWLQSAPVGR